MTTEQLTSFSFQEQSLPIKFVEEMIVKEGVVCQVYQFEGDNTKDLGIVTVESGIKTPLQKVLQGDRTIEGWISGKGTLTITGASEEKRVYEVGGESQAPFSVVVDVGQIMQWQAARGSVLKFYEICYPPYQDGRYENLAE